MAEARRLIVAEDEEDLVLALRRPLLRAGFELVWCPGMEIALVALVSDRFEGALIDVHLGSLPLGLDLIAAIRADPKTSWLPVVSMSGAGPKDLERSLERGADAALAKPFTLEDFQEAFERALRARAG